MSMDIVNESAMTPRERELLQEQDRTRRMWTDRMFARLLLFQWAAGIVIAAIVSPRTWMGSESSLHVHLLAAVVLGGVISGFPIVLTWRQPGGVTTRHAVAIAQMLTSALLIHLCGGRIETHFHVFGSLAFLAFYGDVRVLLTATIVVAVDHCLRGILWPQSVFGVVAASQWRWIEHAAWVLFENFFLVHSICHSRQNMLRLAQRQASLEAVNVTIENQVLERTRQLRDAQENLMTVSRQAGMAEVATGVIHNVGNVLNSVNVSAEIISEKLRRSKSDGLARLAELCRGNQARLAEFLSADDRGRRVPEYLGQLAIHLDRQREEIQTEVRELQANINHIKQVVAMQQNFAKRSGCLESVNLSDLVEDALRINQYSLLRHDIQVERQFEAVPPILLDKYKVVQILVNLITNAKYACDTGKQRPKRVTLRVADLGPHAAIIVSDNGIGIPSENVYRIFSHGFTTRSDGHGFGLHSGAVAAREMGGAMQVESDGLEMGATFTLLIPKRSESELEENGGERRRAFG